MSIRFIPYTLPRKGIAPSPKTPTVPVTELKSDKHRVYTPHGAARQVWGDRKSEVIVLDGPAGTGKTRGLLEKANLCAMKYGGCRILLLRKVREDLTQSVLTTFEDHVLPENSPLINGPKRSLRQEYVYPTGSRIVCAGLDKPQKVMSSEWDLIIMFEATEFSENDFEYLTIRNRNGVMPYQQIIIDCNPASPQHWIWKAVRAKKVTRYKSVHRDNPKLFNMATGERTKYGQMYLPKLDRLTGVRRKRYFLGEWVAAEGAIYEYDAQTHELRYGTERFPFGKIPESWRRIRVVDFGYSKPFVCQWWAIDNDGRMYLYREIYMSRRLVRDHANLILLYSKGENIEATVADWDAEGRADLERCGIPTVQAWKDIEAGIQACEARMRVEGDGKPRLMFMEDSLKETDELLKEEGHPLRTTEEFDSYVRKKQKDGMEKEEPIDEYNHGMDAMRYGVAYIDGLGIQKINVSAAQAVVVQKANGQNNNFVVNGNSTAEPGRLNSVYFGPSKQSRLVVYANSTNN
jgi:PBSX family phage terminase large subunit